MPAAKTVEAVLFFVELDEGERLPRELATQLDKRLVALGAEFDPLRLPLDGVQLLEGGIRVVTPRDVEHESTAVAPFDEAHRLREALVETDISGDRPRSGLQRDRSRLAELAPHRDPVAGLLATEAVGHDAP